MFGNSDNIRTKTDDNQENSCCYGGFGRRFLYEQCARRNSSRRIGVFGVVSVLCVCIMVGAFGILCGIVMYHIVEAGKLPDYRSGAVLPHETSAVHKADAERGSHQTSLLSNSDADGTFENVTSEVSARYRVPTGVMIKRVDTDSGAYAAGFRSGDILVSIDGVPIRDIDGMNKFLSMRDAVARSKVMVFRNNAYIEIEVAF